MARAISQREARRLQKRVELLEARENGRRRAWGQEWFGGVEIARATYANVNDVVPLAIRTARKLSHAVVVVGDESSTIRFIALPMPEA